MITTVIAILKIGHPLPMTGIVKNGLLNQTAAKDGYLEGIPSTARKVTETRTAKETGRESIGADMRIGAQMIGRALMIGGIVIGETSEGVADPVKTTEA